MIEERQYIKEALYDWVAAVVADEGRTDQVIWDNEDGPRPVPPFISIEFRGTGTPGSPDYSFVNVGNPDEETEELGENIEPGEGGQTISRFVRRSLTMYAFGNSAMDLLETIKASIDKEKYHLMLELKGLAIPQALDVTENPVNRSGIATENSALFDFFVTYTRVMTDTPGWVETTEIEPPPNLPMSEITNEEEEANG